MATLSSTLPPATEAPALEPDTASLRWFKSTYPDAISTTRRDVLAIRCAAARWDWGVRGARCVSGVVCVPQLGKGNGAQCRTGRDCFVRLLTNSHSGHARGTHYLPPKRTAYRRPFALDACVHPPSSHLVHVSRRLWLDEQFQQLRRHVVGPEPRPQSAPNSALAAAAAAAASRGAAAANGAPNSPPRQPGGPPASPDRGRVGTSGTSAASMAAAAADAAAAAAACGLAAHFLGPDSLMLIRDAEGYLDGAVLRHQETLLSRCMSELVGQVGGCVRRPGMGRCEQPRALVIRRRRRPVQPCGSRAEWSSARATTTTHRHPSVPPSSFHPPCSQWF